MKRFFVFLVAVLVAAAFSACGTPRQPPPDYERIHEDHQEAQEDLADEENKKKEKEDE
jgi:hypothetical protein